MVVAAMVVAAFPVAICEKQPRSCECQSGALTADRRAEPVVVS